jgi:hypothetical protein
VRNDAGTFLRKLDERVKYYDNEIEKLCNFQYQSFVKAFHELLQVRKDTTSMKVRNYFFRKKKKDEPFLFVFRMNW